MAKKVLTDLNATGRTITATTFSGDFSGTVGGVTFSGTNGTTITLPATTATLARTDDVNTFTGTQTFSGQITANGNVGSAGGTSLTVFSGNTSSTTASANVIMRSGNQTGTAASGTMSVLTGTTAGANTGAVNVASGAAVGGTSGNATFGTGTASSFTTGSTTIRTGNATSATSGAVSILTGTTTTSGNSGSIYLNVGTAAGTAGGIGIGNATLANTVAPSVINIGTTGVPISLTGNIVINGQMREAVYTTATGFAGYTFYVTTNGAIQYSTAAATANGTVNFASTAGETLNTLMSTGQSITCVLLITNTATARYPTAYQIDGTAITPKWQGGTAPTGGNANSIDSYTFTIIKTASATYTVLATQTKFA